MPDRSPCQGCPWRTANRGRRHPDGWYRISNVRRLWAGMRRGEHMTCHPTDPGNPVSEKALAAGVKAAPEGSQTIQCIGGVLLQQREWMVFQELYDGDFSAYRKARPRGMTRAGLFTVAMDFMGAGFLSGGERFKPNLDDPVDVPGLDWPKEALNAQG